jgi:hypothetical protein
MLRSPKFPSPDFPESATVSEVSAVLKQKADLRTHAHSAIVSPKSGRLANLLEITEMESSLSPFMHVSVNSLKS